MKTNGEKNKRTEDKNLLVRRLSWLAGTLVLVAAGVVILRLPMPILFYPDLPHVLLFRRAFSVILISSLLCLYRIMRGPTAPDRVVAIDILGTLIVGLCALLSIPTGRTWYMDIGIAWALQSFIGTLALAKYLRGKYFDE